MLLFGKEMSKREIMDRVGDLSQLGGIKSYVFDDGAARGIRALDLKTPAGIDKGGEYVCGIEPGNLFLTSIEEAKKLNNIEYIEPDEEKKFRLEFKVLASKKNINEVKNKLSK